MSEKSQARKKYERQNPLINFRVSREKKEKLDKTLEKHDITNKEFMEAIIDENVAALRQESKIYEEGYEDGYDDGFEAGREDAKEEYKIRVPCSVCGEPLPVKDDEMKEDMREVLEHASDSDEEPHWYWRHSSCV